jgi:hypothetical protein
METQQFVILLGLELEKPNPNEAFVEFLKMQINENQTEARRAVERRDLEARRAEERRDLEARRAEERRDLEARRAEERRDLNRQILEEFRSNNPNTSVINYLQTCRRELAGLSHIERPSESVPLSEEPNIPNYPKKKPRVSYSRALGWILVCFRIMRYSKSNQDPPSYTDDSPPCYSM